MVNLSSIRLEEMEGYPYVYFYQGEDAPDHFYEEAFGAVPRDKAIACTDRASLSELIVALNGYTVTSGILVGVTDGTLLTTVPMDTDLELMLGYVTRKGSRTLSELVAEVRRQAGLEPSEVRGPHVTRLAGKRQLGTWSSFDPFWFVTIRHVAFGRGRHGNRRPDRRAVPHRQQSRHKPSARLCGRRHERDGVLRPDSPRR